MGIDSALEDGLILIHASIGEEQGGVVVGNDGGRRDCLNRLSITSYCVDAAQRRRVGASQIRNSCKLTENMISLLVEVEEGVAHRLGGPLNW